MKIWKKSTPSSAGQNCTNDADEIEKSLWEARTVGEISKAEKVISNLMGKGKNIIMLSIPSVPCTQMSTRKKKEARKFINNHIVKLIRRANTIDSKPGTAGLLTESDASYTSSTDFKDERHLTQLAMERRISQLDQILPENRRLRNNMLKARPTCDPYSACYGAYPAGCNYCTKLNHSEQDCPLRKKQQGTKRQNVSGSEMQDPKVTKTG